MRISRWAVLAVLLLIFCTLPFWSGESVVSVFALVFLYMALGQMWNLLAGYTGLVSLGQQIFIGLGGYTLAVATEFFRLPISAGILAGGIVSLVFALVISPPIFKMRGVYFAIGTWIVAESLAIFFSNWTYVQAGQGINISIAYGLSITSIYYLALCFGLAALALVYYLLRSRFGLALMAMRDNESAAETLGVELYKTKLKCYLISAFVTGITGGALYLSIAYIQPNAAFGINWTIAMVFMVIIGGIGTVEGPVLGALIYVLLNQYLYNFPGISMIILGAVAIIVILVAPGGIMGTLQERFGFELISVRRKFKEA
jgi:branched-chain amino acid transport system permease protein